MYIVGSWYQTSSGFFIDAIVEGKVDTITVKSVADRNTLIAMEGELWNNIKVTSSGVLDLSSATQLLYDASEPQPRPSAASSIKNNGGLLELDGIYSGYTIDDDAPVYIITRTDVFVARLDVGIVAGLDEEDFSFAYLDADADQVVSAIYIIKYDM
ncbi:MAG: hypothetical protein FWH57_12950 [Oscillospiraceae bacterium]|nr:hypothetical protein [Oscillospiraceae bacterium]